MFWAKFFRFVPEFCVPVDLVKVGKDESALGYMVAINDGVSGGTVHHTNGMDVGESDEIHDHGLDIGHVLSISQCDFSIIANNLVHFLLSLPLNFWVLG